MSPAMLPSLLPLPFLLCIVHLKRVNYSDLSSGKNVNMYGCGTLDQLYTLMRVQGDMRVFLASPHVFCESEEGL